MKKINNPLKVFLLATVLAILSVLFIVVNGRTYTVELNNIYNIRSIDDLNITIEQDDIVACIDKSVNSDKIKLTFESKEKGKAHVNITDIDGNYYALFSLHVHNFGIISYSEYLGMSNGSIIVPISITILLMYILYLLVVSYKNTLKENMYQYKNVAYLGMIFFVTFAIIHQLFSLFNYHGIIQTINGMLYMFSFAIILLPIAFIVSVLVIISNISLIKKEGFNFRNLLGIVLGIFLCISTMLPDIMYNMLYSAQWIDIHNEQSLGLYIYNFVVSIIFAVVTYIECVLLGTIIVSIKSAKHIPSFDKDCILILGCQIKSDGTLTKLLKNRVDRAIEFSKLQKQKTGKDIIFVPSGGQGSDEIISEAQAIKNYLTSQGIKEDCILIEDKSKNTFENIKFSNKVITEKIKDAKIAFATTNYHVFRAGCIATSQNIYMEGIGSKTKSYFWINAFIREFVATLFSERKKHIAVIFSVICVIIILTFLTYINGIV